MQAQSRWRFPPNLWSVVLSSLNLLLCSVGPSGHTAPSPVVNWASVSTTIALHCTNEQFLCAFGQPCGVAHLAWEIPWAEEPGGLQSMRFQSLSDWARMHTRLKDTGSGCVLAEVLLVSLWWLLLATHPKSEGLIRAGVKKRLQVIEVKCNRGRAGDWHPM